MRENKEHSIIPSKKGPTEERSVSVATASLNIYCWCPIDNRWGWKWGCTGSIRFLHSLYF